MARGKDESYRPREDDHLVEPLFGGLGVGEDEEALVSTEEVLVDRDEHGFFVRLVRRVVRITRRARDR